MKKLILLIGLTFIAIELNSQNFIDKDLVLKWNDGNTNWTTSDAYSHILTSGQVGNNYPFQNRGNLVFQPRANNGADIVFGTGAIPLVRAVIKGNGNVGIGTTNPATLLNVNVGNGGTNGVAGVRIGGLGNYASLELGIDGNYDGMIRSFGNNLKYYAGHWKVKGVSASENHSHSWYTSRVGSSDWSTAKMTLNHKGNLGIGTTNPSGWKLAVNGQIRAKEIKVETGWSDFVFEKEYDLPTLIEVENHIKEKGHLKDIPSAKEVEKNGIFLGEMNSKLLQKIEELTLYIIAQEKNLKKHNSKINKLEKENKSLKSINSKFIEIQKRLKKLEEK